MNNNGFARESTEIVNSIAGVILADKTRISLNKFPFLKENLTMIMDESFNRITVGNPGYIAGLADIRGKDYLMLNYAGSELFVDLSMGVGLPKRRLTKLDKIFKDNDIGYGIKLVPKNHDSVPYALSNVVSSADLLNNTNISDNDIFGPREQVKFKVNEHNYAKPNKDSYDLVMSPFNKN